MIDLTATRDLLAQVITGVTVDGQPLHVYRGAITGHLQVPTAVLGIPEHEFATGSGWPSRGSWTDCSE